MIYEYFPEDLNALRQEIDNHPDLLVILSVQQDKDVYIQLAEIAAYCGIVLDGEYTRDALIKLCGIMVNQLQSRRIKIILPMH